MALVAIQTAIPCFVCHGRNFTDNAEYFMRLFDTDTDDGETKTSQLLSSILGRPLTQETVHSPLLCRTCAQLCDEYEMMLNRLESIRVSIIESYNETIDAYCQAAEEQQKQLEREQEQQQLASKEEPLSAYVTSVAATDQPAQFVINHADNNIIVEVNVNGLIGVDNVTTAMPAYTIHDQGIVLPSITSTIDISGQPAADPAGPIDSSYVHDEFDSVKLDSADYSELMQTASATAPLQSNLFDVHSMRPIFLRDGQSFLCQLCGDADVTDPDKPPAIYSSETICSHLRTEHDERVYICHMCGCDYRQRDELVDHLRTHVTEGAGDDDDDYSADNQIDYCDEDNDAIDGNAADSNLPSSADVHQRPVIETSNESLTCPVCAHSSPTVHQMRQHKRQHHASAQKLFACQCCAKRFKSSNMLREHANTHTGERPYKCTDCPKDFASKYTLTSHRKIHTDRKRPFACAECPKRFYSLQNLLQHGRTHSGVRQHECIECGKTFGSAHNLYVHRVVHTGERPFKCHDCGKAFARRAEFRDHERTHTGERPYGCDVCGATFAQRSNLMSHKRATHLNDKRYKCAACEKSFKRKRLLDYHVKVSHTGERPLECGTCAATFVYPEHFKKHMRIHSGLKPFACEVCGKAFSSRDNRNAHRFVHSDKKPYECLCCGQGFMRKPLLLAHMKVRQHESKKIVVNRPRIMKSAPNAGGAGGRGAESEEGEHDGVAEDYEESGAEVVELDDAELDEYVIEAEEEDGEEEEDEDEEDVDDDLESTAALSNVVIMNDGGVVEFDDIIFEDPLDETVFE